MQVSRTVRYGFPQTVKALRILWLGAPERSFPALCGDRDFLRPSALHKPCMSFAYL